jgi:hypothetical protein
MDDEDAEGVKKKRRMQVLTHDEEMRMMMSVDTEPMLPDQWRSNFRDDISGEPLDDEAVKKGEEEEIAFVRKSGLYN